MTIALTRAEVLALHPCNTRRIPKFAPGERMTARQALAAGATVPDLLWVLGELGRKDLCVRYAVACAQAVAHLTTDARSAAAIAAAQAWLDEPTEDNRWEAARVAADAAAKVASMTALTAASAASASSAADWATSAATRAAAAIAWKLDTDALFLAVVEPPHPTTEIYTGV